MNLTLLLTMAVDGYPDRCILGAKASGYTASRLQQLSLGGAQLAQDADAGAIIYLDVNGPCFPAAMFAAAYAGVPLVTLNYRLGTDRLTTLIGRHQRSIAIASPPFHKLFERAGIPVLTSAAWLDKASEATGGVAELVGDAAAVVIYTSGTTSESKGVVLRHSNLVQYVLGTVDFGSAAPDEASLVSLPPYHIAAVANALTNLYAGRRCIVLEDFDGDVWLDTARREQVTHALVVPTMLVRILGARGDKSMPTLRSLAYGGARMPSKVIEQAMRLWPHVDYVNAYGLTETSSTIAVLGPDDHRETYASNDPAVRARLGSVGRPVGNVTVEIRDSGGTRLPPNNKGRIWVRGEQVSGEYLGIGSTLDDDGFFDTRDEGYFDDAGYLFVHGRADDTIIRGGENISPTEIEEALLAEPGVLDAAVVGIPDEEWGERIEAVVVAASSHDLDPQQLRSALRARLRGSKTPDRILVWDSLPRTDTGKLLRRAVIEKIAGDVCGSRG